MSYRLRCGLCLAEWTSERIEDCRTCGAEQVSYTELVPRDDTVTLAEVLAFLRDDSEPTPPEWLRAADAVEARFGAGRADRTDP